jgi:hypothetical protein
MIRASLPKAEVQALAGQLEWSLLRAIMEYTKWLGCHVDNLAGLTKKGGCSIDSSPKIAWPEESV